MPMITTHHVGNLAVDRLTVETIGPASSGGAYPHYLIGKLEENDRWSPLTEIDFQDGTVKHAGVNGITMETILAICIHRLGCFQVGALPSTDNQEALDHLTKALACLQHRTRDRLSRGVEGSSKA